MGMNTISNFITATNVDLYDIVAHKIIEFCEKTYYGDVIFSFEQSYNGKDWSKEVEFATFFDGTNLEYESDWNEGQTYLQNLRIWHLEDSEPVVRCKDCKWWDNHLDCCSYLYGLNEAEPENFCSYGKRVDEVE